ncbi:MAG: hypothetical protein LBU83_06940 [Bacteroidales bacterium]|jgi:hypothetical protein|nr:hypothetical protein [Bacteroidales bacterium]
MRKGEKMLKDNIEEELMEDGVKYYIFVKEGHRHFTPQYFSSGMTSIEWIFPIPEANAIGTLDGHNNGIAVIIFGDYGVEPKCKVVAKDYEDRIYDLFYYRFSPNYTNDTITYSQNRVAVIANLKTNEAFYARSDLSTNDYMLGIRFLDPKENTFVIAKSIKESNGRWGDYLHIVKLEDQELVEAGWSMKIGETYRISPNFPLYSTWLVHNQKLFVLDRDQIICTDGQQSISHPFSEIYNANSKRIGKIEDIAIHPHLPFGVMVEKRVSSTVLHGLVIIRWDTDDADEQVSGYSKIFEPLAPLFGLKIMALAYQSFSPCGKWYVVGCIAPDGPKNPYFIALPVDQEHPDLLDRDGIIILGQVKNMTSLAWTSDPTAYVVSNGELLHKWDLDELSNARVFVMPGEDDDEVVVKKASVFKRISGLFGGKK